MSSGPGFTKRNRPVGRDPSDHAAMLVGSRPRSKGMERRDLLAANAEIFKTQGRALNEAQSAMRVLWWLAILPTPMPPFWRRMPPIFLKENITSMIRLDHNRALSQIAAKAGLAVHEV